MRWWWLSIVIACGAPRTPTPPPTPPPPPATLDAQPAEPVVRVHRPITLAVLGLEAALSNGTVDPETTRIARDLTLYLRNRAREDAHAQLTPEKELVDEKLLNNCDDEAPGCMTFVGRGVGAEYVLFGRVTRNGSRWDVALKLLEVASQNIWSWNGVTTGERAALESLANGAYDELTSHVPAT